MEEPAKIPLINEVCFCLDARKRARLITRFYDKELKASGVRSTQFSLLACLAVHPYFTLSDIAEVLGMDRTTLTRNAKPLLKLSYIKPGMPKNRRSKTYVLTDEGRLVFEKAIPLWTNAQESRPVEIGDYI